MISRREVMSAGVLGTLATANPAIAEIQSDVQALKDGFKSIKDVLDDLKNSTDQGLRGSTMNFGNVGKVKDVILKYAKVSGKFPEYCDIGVGVFYDIYDWHVRNNQQIQISRLAENRLAIVWMFTQLILRWENDETYVGVPY